MNLHKPDITQIVSPFLLFFIINATQIGEGLLSFEREIADIAGYDAWITTIISGLLTTVVIVIIWKIITDEQTDWITIHHSIFGKIIGNCLTILFGLYALLVSIIVLISYIEIIQIWFFPDMSIVLFLSLLFILVLYICLGGFRIVVGFAFFSFFITSFLAVFKYKGFVDGNFSNIFPLFNTPIQDIIRALEPMSFSFLGIELILIYAPFIKRFKSGLKWAIGGNLLSSFTYLMSAIIIFMYYNEQQIQTISWPTLQLMKVINLPIVERFEYLGISLHFIAIIATSCLYFWSSIQCFQRITPFKLRTIGIIFALIGVFSVYFINNFLIIDLVSHLISRIGLIVLFAYIPLLFIIKKVIEGVKSKNAKN
ncbi:GerAB/ArcD/ProY family transporter [Gracilibacillus sp. S3-1-1]|uniref:GerAB/ArcD/ProY family transporter n=1 Tax=Gracilibacillus pellucidus TaxID=3095368 RepID=A0ACC6M178_9BACI|nr:GerAB/ArcD/ProY family transporter [Gracilibacillus sp. S3-1-1]MDX8044709.1 GerAB/ArcD/ProY family transporter [Gracilibacillus sp. S3-1-1]